ncbi:MAG: CCDC90 family protein [Candidatus Magnetoovum sp. WYHC-5]|nr:CCDC90 family protein [Candidatus Magnetoovum sp. WYHC-5]
MPKTIELYNVLKDKIGEDGAAAIIDAFDEVTEKAKKEAATKADLKEEIGKARAELREEIGKVRAELKEEIGKVRAELKEEIVKTNERITRLEGEMKGEFKSLRLEMKIFFLIIIFILVFSNPKAMDLVAKLISMFK